MNYEEFTKHYNDEKEFLDTLDLTEAINNHEDLYDLMNYIENTYQKDYKIEPYIFNCMSSNEFLDYLQRRYDLIVREEIKYKINFRDNV